MDDFNMLQTLMLAELSPKLALRVTRTIEQRDNLRIGDSNALRSAQWATGSR